MNVGDVINEKFELIRCIGQGGMGSVWEARHMQLGRRVALKFLRPEHNDDQEAVSRFIREAQAASSIGSDYIADVTDVGTTKPDGAPYLVMELLEGHSLAQLLRRDGNFEPMRAARLIRQLARALHAAHEKGIVHRDVKPDNVYVIVRDDGSEQVKVLDFGIAKFRDALKGEESASLTATGITLGTPYYMAPEQARALKDLDGRTDVYSAGVVLYELLTGSPPFTGGSFSAVVIAAATNKPPSLADKRPDLPPGYEKIVLRAMEQKRKRRYSSAQEFADALAPFASRRSSAALPAPEYDATRPAKGAIPPPTSPAIPIPEELRSATEDNEASSRSTSSPPVGTMPPPTAVVAKSDVDAMAATFQLGADTSGPSPSPEPPSAKPARNKSVLLLVLGIVGITVLGLLGLSAVVCGGYIYERGMQAGKQEGLEIDTTPQTDSGSPLGSGVSAGASHDGTTNEGPLGGPAKGPPAREDANRHRIVMEKILDIAEGHYNQKNYPDCLIALQKAKRATPPVTCLRAKCQKELGEVQSACIALGLLQKQRQPCGNYYREFNCDVVLGIREN